MKQWDAKLSRKIIHTVVTVVLTLVIFGGAALAFNFYKHDTETTLTDNPGKQIISTVKATNAADAGFTEAHFTFNLPSDWKKTAELTTGPYHKYSYQATKKNADNRYLDVYIDSIPTTMVVNKEVAVHAEGGKLTHGEISENCANFTTMAGLKSAPAPAKWDGVNFLCDMDGTSRNIAGTSSTDAVNKVTLQADDGTKHDFFFVYEDDNYNPDYGIFYNVLDSFSVK